MLEVEPDIVVSGINNTANLGDDVIYSGTVAAAMEGRFLGLPAVAMSLATADHKAQHYETAARAAVEIIARLATDPLPADTILNVNVPDLAWDDVRGFEVTRLGNRHRAEAVHPAAGSARPHWWWIGAAGPEQDAGAGHRFPCRAQRPHLDHADPRRPDPLPGAGAGRQLGRRPRASLQHAGTACARMTARMRLQPEAIGLGMTSQRVRDRLVERLRENGIRDERVLNAIRTRAAAPVRRRGAGHARLRRHRAADRPRPDHLAAVGGGEDDRGPARRRALPKTVLEIGTGSGYQAAILAALGLEVYTVERIGELLRTARKRFRTLGMNVRSKHDDGRIGWPEHGAVRRDHRHRRRAGAGRGVDRPARARAARWSRRSAARRRSRCCGCARMPMA